MVTTIFQTKKSTQWDCMWMLARIISNFSQWYIFFLSQLEKYQDVIKATEEFETKLVSLGIENFSKQLVFFSLYAQLGIFIKIKIIGSGSFSFALILWFVTQIFCYHLGLVPEGTNNLTSYVKDVGIHFGNKKVYYKYNLCIVFLVF